ncbi:hypothetical protein LZ554_004710 [Drepanopeziza brunnea f. sp. 'monogermtubi']|nr:hypothetical protein LZ554_004710 [Drepanopeziza brunnea f. sp. 'monogermtubi']
MLRSQSTFALLLALSLCFHGAHGYWWDKDKVIGYAMVSRRQAYHINLNNYLLIEESTSGQVGPGFSILNTPGWGNPIGKWFCAVEANKKALRQIRKVWIPESYEKELSQFRLEKEQLWGADESVILNYIESEALIPEPEKALRFSWVQALNRQPQMTIPTDVADNADLDFWAKCFESEKELRKHSDKTIDWEKDWKITKAEVRLWIT